MTAPTYTKTGTKTSVTTKLPVSIFGVEVKNHEEIKAAYVAYLANGRQASAKTLTRGEVSGGGRKPWRQKGTGRARFGSSRVPIWRKGGVAHGPTGEENYTHSVTARTKRTALRQALSLKASDGRVSVIDALELKEPKTKLLHELMTKLQATNGTLLVVDQLSDTLKRSSANLGYLKIVRPGALNVFDVMNAELVLFEQKTLEEITARLSQGGAS